MSKQNKLLLISLLSIGISSYSGAAGQSLQGKNPSPSSVASAAFSHNDLSASVNARTGTPNLSHKLAHISSHGLSKTFTLSLNYSPSVISADNPYYVSDHWVYALPYVKKNVLYTGIGQAYYYNGLETLPSGRSLLQFKYDHAYDGRITTSARVYAANLPDMKVESKSGMIQHFHHSGFANGRDPNPNSPYLVLRKIVYPKGYKVWFNYHCSQTGNKCRLVRINDNLDNKITINKQTDSLTVSSTLQGSRNVESVVTLNIKPDASSIKLSAKLKSIETQGGRTAKFSYYSKGMTNAPIVGGGLIKSITTEPTGEFYGISYGKMHVKQSAAPGYYLIPVVSEICSVPVANAGYIKTTYQYGGPGHSPEGEADCGNLHMTNKGPMFSKHNYTGYNDYLLTADNDGLFSSTQPSQYVYHVNITKSTSLGTHPITVTQYYDNYHRLLNSALKQGIHEKQVAYSYSNEYTPVFGEIINGVYDISANNNGNHLHTPTHSNNHPKSPIYDLAKYIKTQIKDTANGLTFNSSVVKQYDEAHGQLLQSTAMPANVTRQITYDTVHVYADVPSIPKIIKHITSGGTFTTVNTISRMNAKTLKIAHGAIVDSSAQTVSYFVITDRTKYYQPSQTPVKGLDLTGWHQIPSGAYGWPLTRTSYSWGDGSDERPYPYMYSQTLSYPKDSPYYIDDNLMTVKTNAGTLSLPQSNSSVMSYDYQENSMGHTHSVTKTKVSSLGPDSNTQHNITTTRTYDSSSGLMVGSVRQIQTDAGVGSLSKFREYDTLGRVISKQSVVSVPGESALSGNIVSNLSYQYSISPVYISTFRQNLLTGYTHLTEHATGSNGIATSNYDNAFGEDSQGQYCTEQYGTLLCKISTVNKNILGQTTTTTSYNSAASDINGTTSYSTKKAYDDYGRLSTIKHIDGTQRHIVYADIWRNPNLYTADNGAKTPINKLEGYKVRLTAHHLKPKATSSDDDAVISGPISIVETSLKTGHKLAVYVVPYPDPMGDSLTRNVASYCPPATGITTKCLKALIANNVFYRKTTYTYNELDKQVKHTSIAPNAPSYDENNLISTHYTYNALGDHIAHTGPASEKGQVDNRTIHTRYNVLGQRICMAMQEGDGINACNPSQKGDGNGLGEALLLGTQSFDAAGDMIALHNGAGERVSANTYDIDGSPKVNIDVMGQQTHAQYNVKGLLSQTSIVGSIEPDAQSFATTKPWLYQYDDATNRLQSTTQGQYKTSYAYYTGGHTKKVDYLNPHTETTYSLKYQYDPSTAKTTKVADNNGYLRYWDSQYGLAQIEYYNRSTTPILTLQKHYNALGQLEAVTRNAGYNTYYRYSPYGLTAEISIGPDKAQPLLTYQYRYTATGNPMEINAEFYIAKSHGNATYRYHYNNKNQLTGFTIKASTMALYPKNAFGTAIIGQKYSYGMNDNIKTVKTLFCKKSEKLIPVSPCGPKDEAPYDFATYQYDSNYPERLVNVTHKGNYHYEQELQHLYQNPFSYYKNGQIKTDTQGGKYTYNNANQLIQYQSSLTRAKPVTVNYDYNAHGLVARETSTLAGVHNSINGIPVDYYYDHSKLVAQSQGDNHGYYLAGIANIINSNNTSVVEHLYGAAQGSIVATSRDINHIHQITHQYNYTPYGIQSDVFEPINAKQQDHYQIENNRKVLDIVNNSFSYTGQQRDSSTRYMMLGDIRNYDPNLGRFIQHDSMNPFSKHHTYDPYAYARANSMIFVDTSGHFPEWASYLLGGIGLVASIAATVATVGATAGLIGADVTATAGAIASTAVAGVGSASGLASASTGIAATAEAEKGNKGLAQKLNYASLGTGIGASVLDIGVATYAGINVTTTFGKVAAGIGVTGGFVGTAANSFSLIAMKHNSEKWAKISQGIGFAAAAFQFAGYVSAYHATFAEMANMTGEQRRLWFPRGIGGRDNDNNDNDIEMNLLLPERDDENSSQGSTRPSINDPASHTNIRPPSEQEASSNRSPTPTSSNPIDTYMQNVLDTVMVGPWRPSLP
ncbi:MAG TPA: RHS repeat-associated core domain-containing protein [Nitrospinota bacterium]|nr:RHS repeat-associated core domain-containing protein [Nitrospinota bacterium]|tara:strand:- start:749 stop:6751 length:6003 start_codon:yes stop_codon:yes gene_type:complete